MKHVRQGLRDTDDAALERLLVERWLYRGALLAVLCLSAIVCTYLGVQGVDDAR